MSYKTPPRHNIGTHDKAADPDTALSRAYAPNIKAATLKQFPPLYLCETFGINKTESLFVLQFASKHKFPNDSATHTWNRISKKNNVRDALRYVQKHMADFRELYTTHVLDALQLITTLDLVDIVDQETGMYKPVHQWPKVWQKNALSVKINKYGQVSDVLWPNKVKVLELIGRHIDVSAWNGDSETSEPATALTINFNVNPPVKDIKVVNGDS